jgi:hypothetical protein
MISLDDCIGRCGSRAQRIRMTIVEDIHKALDAGHIRHAAELFMA